MADDDPRNRSTPLVQLHGAMTLRAVSPDAFDDTQRAQGQDADGLLGATPDLDADPETQRVRASVASQLFGDDPVVARIGRYPIFAKLGQGAMGVVYACYDERLDRRVAVKVLRTDRESSRVRARILREARAMAKLSHPNVMHVYEVGEQDGRLFVAMEYVEGATLRAWWRAAPRTWSEILATCIAAGRGLAASHREGLTHRDFKPDNVMVGRDGRVRVTDFGLVRFAASTTNDHADDDEPDVAGPLELTRKGALVGTPAYMAPEQVHESEGGPAADQFAFCVTLWEALHGTRPFVAETTSAMIDQVRSARLLVPADAPAVPRWLRRVLTRGLAAAPGDRWPSMDELLAALERGTGRARLRRAAVVVLGVGAVVLGIVGMRASIERSRVSACEAEGASISDVWNDDARARVHAGLQATGVAYAGVAFDRIAPAFDDQAARWQAARTEACLDASVREVWDAEQLDRSSWCLEDRRVELAALVDAFSAADTEVASMAVQLATSQTPVASCRDADRLARAPVPPMELREDVRTLRAELAHITAAGRPPQSSAPRLARLLARADEVGWDPLQALTRIAEAARRLDDGELDGAERFASEAYFLAAGAGAWDIAATAASHLSYIVGRDLRLHEGVAWSRHAEVALGEAGETGGLAEAQRLADLALVYEVNGRSTDARAAVEQALAIEEPLLGPEHPLVGARLDFLGVVHFSLGDFEEMRRLCARALEIREAALGPMHPMTTSSLSNLGAALLVSGDPHGARALHLRALENSRQTQPPGHADFAAHHANLGSVHAQLGELAEARDAYRRALAIREAALGPDDPQVAVLLAQLADVELEMNDAAAAEALLRRALAIVEAALGREHLQVAKLLQQRARVHETTGAWASAKADHERALEILGQPGIDERHRVLGLLGYANNRFVAGDTVVARRLVQEARDGYREDGGTGSALRAEAEVWLAAHPESGDAPQR